MQKALHPRDDVERLYVPRKVGGKVLYCHMQYHNDTIIKQTQEDFFNKIFTSHFIARVRKGYSRFACERELGTE